MTSLPLDAVAILSPRLAECLRLHDTLAGMPDTDPRFAGVQREAVAAVIALSALEFAAWRRTV